MSRFIDVETVRNDKKAMAKMFDHTILKPDATREMIEVLCREAKEYGFASVCVNSCYTGEVKKLLAGSKVLTCVVVGFPLGAMLTEAKAAETKLAVEAGAQEIDMVINVGALKDGKLDYVRNDIAAVVRTAQSNEVKVIIETCLLTNAEKVTACRLACEAGAAYVKTSTGFSSAGADAEDISLMRNTVGKNIGVKASGGIRTYKKALDMIAAGASRIGSSSCVAILQEMDDYKK